MHLDQDRAGLSSRGHEISLGPEHVRRESRPGFAARSVRWHFHRAPIAADCGDGAFYCAALRLLNKFSCRLSCARLRASPAFSGQPKGQLAPQGAVSRNEQAARCASRTGALSAIAQLREHHEYAAWEVHQPVSLSPSATIARVFRTQQTQRQDAFSARSSASLWRSALCFR